MLVGGRGMQLLIGLLPCLELCCNLLCPSTYSTPCSPVCGLEGSPRGRYRLSSTWTGGWDVWVPPTATAPTADTLGAVPCGGVAVGAHWGVRACSHHKHST